MHCLAFLVPGKSFMWLIAVHSKQTVAINLFRSRMICLIRVPHQPALKKLTIGDRKPVSTMPKTLRVWAKVSRHSFCLRLKPQTWKKCYDEFLKAAWIPCLWTPHCTQTPSSSVLAKIMQICKPLSLVKLPTIVKALNDQQLTNRIMIPGSAGIMERWHQQNVHIGTTFLPALISRRICFCFQKELLRHNFIIPSHLCVQCVRTAAIPPSARTANPDAMEMY